MTTEFDMNLETKRMLWEAVGVTDDPKILETMNKLLPCFLEINKSIRTEVDAASGGGGLFVEPDIHVEHRSGSGVGGGSQASSGVRNAPLNTLINDMGGLVTLASNKVTTPAGTYWAMFDRYGMGIGAMRGLLVNTAESTILTGSNTDTGVGTKWGGNSLGFGKITLATAQDLQLLTYNTSGNAGSDALGDITNNPINIHARLMMWKVAA